jgi:dGTPase
VLYTTAFRRLSGITQVISPYTGHVFHNRLTHTLHVAQVGRRLAEKLHTRQPLLAQSFEVSPDIVEAACLAHDLGHPPFGHLAERELDHFAAKDGGFEGNAQSFRIVTELAFRSPDYPGLNLTGKTLAAILKYPWIFSRRPADKQDKWGAYDTEKSSFDFATETSDGGPHARSVEAEIMDWSDDVTYSVHDVEDFFRAGLIPLHLLRPASRKSGSGRQRDEFLEYVAKKKSTTKPLASVSDDDLDSIFGQAIFSFFTIDSPYRGTRDQRARLRFFSSQLIDRYINGLTLCSPNPDGSRVIRDVEKEREIALLKQLTWFYVIEAPSLALQQHTHRRIIRTLCGIFMQEARNESGTLIPELYRDRLANGEPKRRVVADLVASLTEAQAIGLYQRLTGVIISSGLENLL